MPLQFGAADLPLDVADVSKPRDFGLDEVEAMGEQIAVVRVKAAEKLVDRAVEAGILLNEPRPREEAAEAFAPARQDRLDKRVAVEAQLGFLLGEVENMRAHGGEAVTPWACDHLRMRLDQPVHSLRYGFAVVQDKQASTRH